jgi:hypothetical protein
MSYEQYKHANENTARDAMTSDNPMVAELVAVLAPHPGGLRRWSVMRAIRKNREAASRDIPLKLEADIERAFRQFCSDSADTEMRKGGHAIFYRPAEKAGEVWALHRAHITATAK